MTTRSNTSTAAAAAPRARPSLPSLRTALKLDALVTGANGAAYLALAAPLADLLGMPAPFLRAIGAFLLAFAGAVWLLSARPASPRAAVGAVIDANLAWVAASAVVVVLAVHDPTTVGSAWTVAQALVVAGFAALQLAASRRAAGVNPPASPPR